MTRSRSKFSLVKVNLGDQAVCLRTQAVGIKAMLVRIVKKRLKPILFELSQNIDRVTETSPPCSRNRVNNPSTVTMHSTTSLPPTILIYTDSLI